MTAVPRDLWRPSSGCDDDCLPAAGEVPTVPMARRVLRLVAALGMLLAGIGVVVLLPVLPSGERHGGWSAGWARATARALRRAPGGPGPAAPAGGALLVANHVSWLDILAVLAVAPTRMVAKREVRSWPVVGLLAAAAGTVFVDRSRPRALPATVGPGRRRAARRAVGGGLPGGYDLVRRRTAPPTAARGGGFRPATFQAAIDAGSPVVPLRLTYRCAATGDDHHGSRLPRRRTPCWRSVAPGGRGAGPGGAR